MTQRTSLRRASYLFPKLNDVVWLTEQVFVLDRAYRDIATELGCSRTSILNALQFHGIKPKPFRAPWEDQIGRRYGSLVVTGIANPDSHERGYARARLILECDCGGSRIQAMEVLLGSTGARHCGCLDPRGQYKIIRVNGIPYPEHRWLMQQKLGRDLLPEEDVHHINGMRDDNRIDNLELWSRSHPAGQRVKDKVAWARVLLAQYGDMFPE